MTLKSKKLYSTVGNKRNNIKTKMHGGSKFTVVGHDKDPISESDVYITNPTDDTTKKYLFTEYDQKLIDNFLKKNKGEKAEHFEFDETSLDNFIKQLQEIKFGGENPLIIQDKNVKDKDGKDGKPNYEINLEFLKDVLKQMSGKKEEGSEAICKRKS